MAYDQPRMTKVQRTSLPIHRSCVLPLAAGLVLTGLLATCCVSVAPLLQSPNVLRNSTFNQCTVGYQPDYWAVIPVRGTRHSGKFAEEWKGEFFRVDTDSPVPGAKSVRLGYPLELRSAQVTLQHHRTYAFSCYMKSEQDAHKAVLEVGHYDKRNPKKQVTVGREWKRYSVSGQVFKGSWFAAHWQVIITHVYSESQDPLWIAAPQLEFGEEVSPYQPADADRFVASRIEEFVTFPTVGSTMVDGRRPPDLDAVVGTRASAKGLTGPLVSDHDASTLKAEFATYFRVMHDEYNLYVYVLCRDPDISRREPRFKPGAAEWQKVLYDDSVILYVKPDFADEDHFVFGVTPEGQRMDTHMYRFEWESPDWKAQTRVGENRWAACFTIPFHTILSVTGRNAIGDTLGINVRRLRATEATATAKGLRAIDGTLEKGIWFWSPDRFTRVPGAFGKLTGIDASRARVCRVRSARMALAGADRTEVLVELDHVPSLGGQGFLDIELAHTRGDLATRVVPIALDGKPKTIRIEGLGPKWQEGDWRLSAKIQDAAARTMGRTVQWIHVPGTFRLPDNDLLVTLARAYYTTEDTAHLLIESNVDQPMSVEVVVEGDPPATLSSEPILVPGNGRQWFSFGLKGIPEGKHRIVATSTVEVERKGKKQRQVVARAYDILEKLPPAPEGRTEVKIDRVRCILLLDGKPIIPMAMGVVAPERFHASFTRPRGRPKRKGGPMPPDPMAPIKQAGLLAVPWGGGWGSFTNMESFVRATRESGVRVLAWMYHDEPSWRNERKLQEQYRKCKEADPYHPAFFLPATSRMGALQRGPAGIFGASDIYCKSGYPWGMNSTHYTLGQTHYYSLQYWTNYTRDIGSVVRQHRIVGGRNLGTWVGNDRYRLSTPQQNRCLVYTGLANGLRFFSWWPGRPQSDLLWDSLIDLKKELDALAPILGDSQAAELAHGQQGRLEYALWSTGEKHHLIVANPWVETQTFSCGLLPLPEGKPAAAIPLREGDPIAEVRDGAITLRLEPYDCGTYVVSAARDRD